MLRHVVLFAALIVSVAPVRAQERPPFQTDFPAAELAQRRARVMDAIGADGIAILQGAPGVDGFRVFRQTNEFYYLTGLETPHAYLVLDGRTRKATLFLTPRNEALERSGGAMWAAEDAADVIALTGVDAVAPVDRLSRQTFNAMLRPPRPTLYVPISPAEGEAQSRDEILGHQAGVAADPWDGRPSREAHFLRLLAERYPALERRDLTPILDTLRATKSEREIALIRKASVLAGLGLLEAMRSTKPGMHEYETAAAARFTFLANGARYEGYNPIAGGGTNAWMGHYSRNLDRLKAGDMLLMDYAPDLRSYTSDVTRMWPVSGTYTPAQRTLANFILAYRDAFFRYIKAGVTPDEVLARARNDMTKVLAATTFANEHHRKAAEAMLTFRGHLQHHVGMTVHDPGTIWGQPFREGQVFTVDPMMWIAEEKLYVRMEDTVLVTKDGIENFTAFLASTPDEIEAEMKREGVLSRVQRPPSAASARIEGTAWTVVEIAGTSVAADDGPADRQPHLAFGSDGRVSGSDGCNRLVGPYTTKENALTFGRLAGTLMACPTGGEVADRFRRVLTGTSHWSVVNGRLELYGATGKPLAVLVPRPAAAP